MIMLEHNKKLRQLFYRYNSVLQDLYILERIIDDHSLPYFERETKTTEFLRLNKEAKEIIEAIRQEGYEFSEEETRNGFSRSVV